MSRSDSPQDIEDVHRFVDARRLTLRQILKLKQTLESEPDDYDAHLSLAAYFNQRRRKEEECADYYLWLLMWLIRNHPKNRIHCLLHIMHDCPEYYKARNLWFKQVRKYPNDASVLDHAAQCCEMVDPHYSKKFWERASRLDPTCAEWPRNLCRVYMRKAQETSTGARKYWIRKSKQAVFQAFDLAEDKDRWIIDLMRDLEELAENSNCMTEYAELRNKRLGHRLRNLRKKSDND